MALIQQMKIEKSKLPRKCTNYGIRKVQVMDQWYSGSLYKKCTDLVITRVQVTTNAILALIDEARSLDRRGLWADSTLAGSGANLCA